MALNLQVNTTCTGAMGVAEMAGAASSLETCSFSPFSISSLSLPAACSGSIIVSIWQASLASQELVLGQHSGHNTPKQSVVELSSGKRIVGYEVKLVS